MIALDLERESQKNTNNVTELKSGGERLARIHEWYDSEEWRKEQRMDMRKVRGADPFKILGSERVLGGPIREVCKGEAFCQGPWHRYAMVSSMVSSSLKAA